MTLGDTLCTYQEIEDRHNLKPFFLFVSFPVILKLLCCSNQMSDGNITIMRIKLLRFRIPADEFNKLYRFWFWCRSSSCRIVILIYVCLLIRCFFPCFQYFRHDLFPVSILVFLCVFLFIPHIFNFIW